MISFAYWAMVSLAGYIKIWGKNLCVHAYTHTNVSRRVWTLSL